MQGFFYVCLMKQRVRFFTYLVSITLIPFNSYSQKSSPVDSLLRIISSTKEDTVKVLAYGQLSVAYAKNNNPEKGYEEAIKGLTLAKKIKFKRGEALTSYNAGNYCLMLARYPEALSHYENVVKKTSETGDIKLKGATLSNMGTVLIKQGNYPKAMEYLLAGLKTKEGLKENRGILIARMNIGNIYSKLNEKQKSLAEYRKCEKIALRMNYKKELANTYINLGNIFVDLKHPDSSNYYFNKALVILKEQDDKFGLSSVYGNMALNWIGNKEYKKAEESLFESLKLEQEIGHREGLANTYRALSEVYFHTKNYGKAIDFAEKSLAQATLLGTKLNEKEARKILYRIYKSMDKNKEALENYEYYTQINDSIFSEEKQKVISRKEVEFEFEKKEALLMAAHEKEVAIASEEKKKQRIILWSVCGILLVVLTFSLFIYRSYKQKKKINSELAEKNQLIHLQKEIVEEKQKEILDSILYAEQIQKTLIANHDFVNQTIPDSFVVFKPKDIVSGDFYWATKKSGKFYLACCDSTGHGVPGAFMSLLNISFLSEAINEKNILDPGAIFEHVRERLIQNISQHGRKDGMDGVLLCFDENENNSITYCAANNSPVHISKGIAVKLPGDKMPVGKGEKQNSFFTYTINVSKGDMLYIFTDGYPDQFGGEQGKKFKYKQLEELLLTINHLPVNQQSEILDNKFNEWKGMLEQIDDVCILGIRI